MIIGTRAKRQLWCDLPAATPAGVDPTRERSKPFSRITNGLKHMAPSDVPVVILCGGLGTRLREETYLRPKPMVEIGPAPILWHIMKLYSHYGFRRFILCAGYKSHVIKQFFREFDIWGEDLTIKLSPDGTQFQRTSLNRENWEVTVAETGALTGTGGRIKRVEHYIQSDVFMATYGDGLSDIDLAAELEAHIKHGRAATLTSVKPRSRFGVVDFDSAHRVTRFREKPVLDNWVNGGFYVFGRKVLDYLNDDCVLETDPLERLAADGELVAFPHKGYWSSMDTYRDFEHLNEVWDHPPAPWAVWSHS